MEEWHFSTVTKIGKTKEGKDRYDYNLLRHASEKEIEEHKILMNEIHPFQEALDLLNPVIRNYKEIKELVEFRRVDVAKEIKGKELIDLIKTNIVNYISSYGAFMNHWDAVAKKHFKDFTFSKHNFSDVYTKHKKNLVHAPILKVIRNYIQHRGLLPAEVGWGLKQNSEEVEYSVRVTKKVLLEDRRLNKEKKEALAAYPDYFDLLPIIAGSYKECDKFQLEIFLTLIMTNEACLLVEKVDAFSEKIGLIGEKYMLAIFEGITSALAKQGEPSSARFLQGFYLLPWGLIDQMRLSTQNIKKLE